MRAAALAGALLAATITANEAQACSRVRYSADRIQFTETDFAANLVAHAAFVDVAEAEASEPLDVDALIEEAKADITREFGGDIDQAHLQEYLPQIREALVQIRPQQIRYRVIERLKGNGPSTFSLNGLMAPQEALSLALENERNEAARRGDGSIPSEVWNWAAPQEVRGVHVIPVCATYLRAVAGGRYLVFRDAQGRLLGPTLPVTVSGRENVWSGIAYTALPRNDDPWLAKVRKAAGR